jgi:hypothetical protein
VTTFSSISVLAFCSILAACSGSQFSTSSTPSADGPSAPDTVSQEDIDATAEQFPGVTPEGLETTDAPTPAPLVKDEDKTALDDCIKQWSKTPFTPEEIARPRLVEINDMVNNNAVIYTDDKVTEKPTLYLVNFNIKVGNSGQLGFYNPKGWYCFNVKAKIINNFIINTACDTKVAIVSKQAQNDKNFTIAREEPCPINL